MLQAPPPTNQKKKNHQNIKKKLNKTKKKIEAAHKNFTDTHIDGNLFFRR